MVLAEYCVCPCTINPRIRGEWRRNHHKTSGTKYCIEERAITNGEVSELWYVFLGFQVSNAVIHEGE